MSPTAKIIIGIIIITLICVGIFVAVKLSAKPNPTPSPSDANLPLPPLPQSPSPTPYVPNMPSQPAQSSPSSPPSMPSQPAQSSPSSPPSQPAQSSPSQSNPNPNSNPLGGLTEQTLGGTPGALLKNGQYLKTGDGLVSPGNLFKLFLQSDGNICIFDGQTNANSWCFPLSLTTATYMTLSSTGNLSILDSTFKVLWNSGTNTPNGALYMQDDGNLVLYNGSPSGGLVWQAGSQT